MESNSNSKQFGRLFMILTQTVIQSRTLDNLGLTRLQAMALRSVNKQPGITMTQLAKLIGITSPQLTRIISTLEDRDLVQREHNVDNRRIVNVQQTKKGRAVIDESTKLIDQRTKEQLSSLSEQDQLALIHHLQESIRLMDKAQIIKVDDHQ